MATNTSHPVRSARRCILRSALSKFFFATAVAIASSFALGLSGALTAGPQVAQASAPAGKQQHALSGEAFGYPIKPFNDEHPIRANFGDPRMQFSGPPTVRTLMHGTGSFSFHQGVDIAAPNGTAVYPVVDGTVTAATPVWVRVTSGDRAFEYWHIRPLVHTGDHVNADQTVLGHIMKPAGHVHLTEYQNGRVVNPLLPGRLTPYHDSTRPTVRAITLRRGDGGRDLFPTFVRGRVTIVADAYDMPTMAVQGEGTAADDAGTADPADPEGERARRRARADRRRLPHHRPRELRLLARVCTRDVPEHVRVGAHYSYMQRLLPFARVAVQHAQPAGRRLRPGRDGDRRSREHRSAVLRLTVHNRGGWH
jgi:hypothetical protein